MIKPISLKNCKFLNYSNSTFIKSFASNFCNQGQIRSLELSGRTKLMTTTLKWLCPPNLLTAHQSDKVIDLHIQFVKYVVSRREDPRLMKVSRGKLTSLNFDVVNSVVSRPVEILEFRPNEEDLEFVDIDNFQRKNLYKVVYHC